MKDPPPNSAPPVILWPFLVYSCCFGREVGIYLPIAYSGFRGLRAGLITDTYLSAMHIHHVNAQYKELSISKDIEEKMNTMEENENIYENLSRSIAPQIFGHLDIKKSLLLQMVGGVTRDMKDGISIRGEINICLMGDPGVAKSQLLKYISVIAPRSIYTTVCTLNTSWKS